MRLPFVGGSAKARAVEISAERTINWIPEVDPQYHFQSALLKRPGLATWSNSGSAEVRNAIVLGENLCAVVGGNFVTISTDGSVTSRGALKTSTGRVSMSANPTQVLVVDGVDGYIWNGSTFAVIADADFPNTCTHCDYIDGYFVVNDTTNAGRFYISSENDGTAWDATDFAVAQRDPDSLKALIVNYRELWLFGDQSSEVWYNSGDPDFPFDPYPSGFTEWGIQAPNSLAKADGSIYWLAKGKEGSGMVFRSQGLRGVRISTHGIEHRIGAMTTTSDAIGFCMEWRGHVFYVLTFPTSDVTFVYDAVTGLWHEWKSYGIGRFRGNCHAFFNGQHVIGDYQDGNIFQMKDTQLSDAGSPIECRRYDRHILRADSRSWLFHRQFEIQMEAGVGNSSASDPQVMLTWSDDGGHTWTPEFWRDIGKVGEYQNRALWRQLGRSRDRIYQIAVTDNVRANVVSGFVIADLA